MKLFRDTSGGRAIESALGSARLKGLVGGVLVSAALLMSAPANAWNIGFDETFLDNPATWLATYPGGPYPEGRIIDDEFTTPGLIDQGAVDHDPTLTATFSGFKTNGYANPLVLFDSANPSGGDGDLASPFTNPSTGEIKNPGRILILHEHPGNCVSSDPTPAWTNGNDPSAVSCYNPDDRADGGKFVIEFNKEITLESIDFFDIEYGEAHQNGPSNEILLFDINGDQILTAGPFYTPSTGGDNKWKPHVFGVAGVVKIKIKCEGSCAIDNIQGSSGTPPNPVPEPSALLIFGAGLFGATVLRRRRRTARGKAARAS